LIYSAFSLLAGTIEALVNEGALFEQVLMIKVARDPKFKFLFNYASPEVHLQF
jgi:hypothetical protein